MGPKYIRLDAQILPELRSTDGKNAILDGFEMLKSGKTGILISTGYMTHTALNVAETLAPEIELSVLDLIDITGFDKEKFNKVLGKHKIAFSLEEGFEGRGGIDTLLLNHFRENLTDVAFHGLGVKPGYSFELGNRQELHELVGIGHDAIINCIRHVLSF